MALILTVHQNSVHSLAPRLMLAQAGIAYELTAPSTKIRGVCDPRLPLLREAGGSAMYKSAKALFTFLCDKYISLARYFPNKADTRAEISATLDFLQSKLVPAVRTAVTDDNSEPLQEIVRDLVDMLQPSGFLHGDSLSVADVYAVCALRPYMVLDHVLPHAIHDLADATATAMSGWKEIVGHFDRIVLRGDAAGEEEVLPVGHAEAWEGDISPTNPVQPAHLQTLAKNMGVDVASESRLLWLVHKALNTPLPPNWRRVQAGAANFFEDFAASGPSRTASKRSMVPTASRHAMGQSTMSMKASKATMRVGSTTSMADLNRVGSKALVRQPSTRHGHASDVNIDGDASKFLNPTTGEVTVAHPGAVYLMRQIADVRRFGSISGSTLGVDDLPGTGAWMKFTRKPKEAESKGNRRFSALSSGSYGHTASVLAGDVPSGGAGSGAGSGADAEEPQSEEFWHDFETGEDSDELPVGARVIPYPPSPTAEQASVLPSAGTAGTWAGTLASRGGLHTADTAGSAFGGRPDGASVASVTAGEEQEMQRRRKPRSVHELDTLHFKSWWKEGKPTPQASSETRDVNTSTFRRQTVDIFFSIEDGSFKIALHGDDKMYSISHIEGRTGPLECWDLHVGARINVLGRHLTLKQATLATQQWIDHHAIRIDKLIKRMTKELVKYDIDASHQISKKRQQAVTKGGKTNLRAKVDFLDMLRRKLAFYRPKLAQKILQGLVDDKKKKKK